MSRMTTYQKASERRQQILSVACDLAEETHYRDVRRRHLVDRCDTAAGNVSRVMGSMDELRTAIIEYALANDRPVIVAQAIMDKHPAIRHLDSNERGQVLGSMR